MRPKIYNFPQETLLRLGLNLKEILFLDYLEQFAGSGHMRSKRVDEKWYYKITYKKIMDDLPILNIKERQIRNMIARLEKIGIVQRLSDLKREMYLEIDFNAVYGFTLPTRFNLSEIGFHDEGNGLLTIDYYDIKKIKIIHDNARVKDLDKKELHTYLIAKLKLRFGETLFKAYIDDLLYIDEITDKYILFSASNVKVLGSQYGKKFKEAFDETIKELVDA